MYISKSIGMHDLFCIKRSLPCSHFFTNIIKVLSSIKISLAIRKSYIIDINFYYTSKNTTFKAISYVDTSMVNCLDSFFPSMKACQQILTLALILRIRRRKRCTKITTSVKQARHPKIIEINYMS